MAIKSKHYKFITADIMAAVTLLVVFIAAKYFGLVEWWFWVLVAMAAFAYVVIKDRFVIKHDLAQSLRLTLELLDNSSAGIAACGKNGEALLENRNFWKLVKDTNGGEVETAIWSQYGKDGDAIALLEGMRSGARMGSSSSAVFSVNGGWHKLQVFPGKDYIVWRVEDVTEQRKRDDRLKQKQDELAELLATYVMRDIQLEQELEKVPERSEKKFRHFFEDSPIGIVIVDKAGKLLDCNKAFSLMIGRDVGALKNTSMFDLIKHEEKEALSSYISGTLGKQDNPTPIELHLRGEREAFVHVYARKTANGEGFNVMLHFIDLTEQKNLETRFAQSQKMQAVGQLAGGVAHDFNNLLTAMIGFCDLLLLRHKPGDQSFGDIMQIKQNANRAANLVRQLLAFSRQQTLQPKVLDITDVLADLSNLLRRLIGENIELKMVYERDLWPVLVDQGQFEQVIVNLAVNARDAMPSGGKLTITTKNFNNTKAIFSGHEVIHPGDWVSVEVADTGIGIPPENLQRIFEPFFSTKEIGAGTGLGLSTVYGIVHQTGGFVLVDSALGKGAKFTIILPKYKTPDAVAKQGKQELSEEEKEKIDLTGFGTLLLVEDEDAVRVFGARALRNKGYRVLEASSAEEALNMLEKEKPHIDLMITDVIMPNMDGPTLAKEVRKSRPDLKVIFMSGYTEDRLRQHFGPGEAEFLAKPFSLQQLAAKVKEVMVQKSE